VRCPAQREQFVPKVARCVPQCLRCSCGWPLRDRGRRPLHCTWAKQPLLPQSHKCDAVAQQAGQGCKQDRSLGGAGAVPPVTARSHRIVTTHRCSMRVLLLLLAVGVPVAVRTQGTNSIPQLSLTLADCIADCRAQQEISDSTGCCEDNVSWVDGMYAPPRHHNPYPPRVWTPLPRAG
jgi:hypothetical protein